MDKNTRRSKLLWTLGGALLYAVPAWAAAKGGNPAGGVAALLAMGAGMTAFMVWGRSTFPQAARSADAVVGKTSAWRGFWVGLLNLIVLFLLLIVVGKAAQLMRPLGLFVLPLGAAALFLLFRGGLGVWPDYGFRVLGGDEASSELAATLAGGALLTGLSLLFPIGLFFFAYVLVRSLGAGMLACMENRPAGEPAA